MTRSAEQGSIADVGSPVLVSPDPVDAAAPWRWTTGVIASAALLLAVLNAHAIGAWFDDLVPGPATEPLRAPIGRWTAVTQAHGLDTLRTVLRSGWENVRDARFANEQPGQQGAGDAR
jgi:hypothetical protein